MESLVWMLLGCLLTIFVMTAYKIASSENNQSEAVKTNELDWESDDDTDDEQIKPPATPNGYDQALFQTYPIKDLKMMMAVRNDLGMTKGKIGAQCGHATLGSFKQVKRWAKESKYWRKVLEKWSYEGQKKICVKVNSEAEIIEV